MTPEMKKKFEEYLLSNVPVMVSLGLTPQAVLSFVERVLSREPNIAGILYSFGERYPIQSAALQIPPLLPKALWVDVLTNDKLYEFRLKSGSFRYDVTKLEEVVGLEVEYYQEAAILIVYFEGTARQTRITASGNVAIELLDQYINSLRKLAKL